jgi:hypothetical protein
MSVVEHGLNIGWVTGEEVLVQRMVLSDSIEAVLRRRLTTTSSKISAAAGLLIINVWWAWSLLPPNVWWKKSFDDAVVRELSFEVSGYREIIDYRYLFPGLSYHL